MTNAILITNLSKSYGETVVFRNFSASLPLGETTVITGVSGGGKTTLLRLILGLETPDGGEIAGVPARRAAVFQEDRLCPQLTALENVLLTAGRKKEREARDILARLGLGESLQYQPAKAFLPYEKTRDPPLMGSRVFYFCILCFFIVPANHLLFTLKTMRLNIIIAPPMYIPAPGISASINHPKTAVMNGDKKR